MGTNGVSNMNMRNAFPANRRRYIMRDQHRNSVNDIMAYDLTWRQKKQNATMHMSIVAGLSVMGVLSQLI